MVAFLRDRNRVGSGRVGMVELFFDLVFVFAVTQLSHTLLAELTFDNLVRVTVLFLAVWLVWMYTAWMTNWLDPERLQVRIALFVLILIGLFMSVSIPHSFAERGIVFAVAYVTTQVGRALFVLWTMRREAPRLAQTFQRIAVWMTLSGVFWIVGAFAEPDERLAWWTLALGIEMFGPWALYWVPGLGRSAVADWNVDGGHMAERCGLFIIIALGESLLVTGATFAELTWDGPTMTAFFSAVVGSILMWWIYFDTGAQRGEHRLMHAGDPGRTARSAYTYVHIVIVAGIIVCAVADEIVLMHPGSRRRRRVHGDTRRARVLPAGRGMVQMADERSPDAATVARGRSRADRATGMAGVDSYDHAARLRYRYDARVRRRCVLGDGRAIDHTNSRTAGSSLNSGTSKKRYASSQSRSESASASAELCV